MTIGLVGIKRGMTRIFKPDGCSIPVSVIEVATNWVTQVKTQDKEGYNAIQVTMGNKKPQRLNKSQQGHFAKAGVDAGCGLWEFRLPEDKAVSYSLGDAIKVSLFSVGQKVNVVGISIGKGFAGAIKRHNFSSQRASHGNSLSHNAPGSIGQNQTPGRVFKGKAMAGHLGNERVTMENLEVVLVDEEKSLLLVKGAIPGACKGVVVIKPSLKVNKSSKNADATTAA